MIYCLNKTKEFNYNFPYHSIINTVISNADTVFTGNYFIPLKVGSQTYNQLSLVQPEELIKSFDYQYNDFTFHFSATSFIAEIPTKFSCYLEGEDEKWSDWSTESSKIYMNLRIFYTILF